MENFTEIYTRYCSILGGMKQHCSPQKRKCLCAIIANADGPKNNGSLTYPGAVTASKKAVQKGLSTVRFMNPGLLPWDFYLNQKQQKMEVKQESGEQLPDYQHLVMFYLDGCKKILEQIQQVKDNSEVLTKNEKLLISEIRGSYAQDWRISNENGTIIIEPTT